MSYYYYPWELTATGITVITYHATTQLVLYFSHVIEISPHTPRIITIRRPRSLIYVLHNPSPSHARAIRRAGSRSQCSTCCIRGHNLKTSHAHSLVSSIVVLLPVVSRRWDRMGSGVGSVGENIWARVPGPKESIRTISILSLIFMYSNYPQFAPSRVLWVSTTTAGKGTVRRRARETPPRCSQTTFLEAPQRIPTHMR